MGWFRKSKAAWSIAEDPSVLGEHAPTLRDLMTVADGLDVQDTEVYVSPTGFTKTYYVTALPSRLDFAYLNGFFQVGADVHIALHVEPADSALAMSKRNKMMVKIESDVLAEQKAGTNKNIAFLQQQYALLEKEREELRLGLERLFYVTILLTVSSADRDEFEAACERIERKGFEGFYIREAYKEHDLGLKAVAPMGLNVLRHPIEMTGSALANAFPFGNAHFSHDYGVPIGIDWTTGHLNRLDCWHKDLVNHNIFVIGTSGGGKSFLTKALIARSAAFGVQHAILDYDGEYRALTAALGGKSYRIHERSEHRFNPFEIGEGTEKMPDGSFRTFVDVKGKISEMERLIVTMAHLYGAHDPLDAYTTSIVNRLLQDMYERDFGFTEDPASLREATKRYERDVKGDRILQYQYRPQPRFSDFYQKLEAASETDGRLKDLLLRLHRFKEGGTEGMFDGYSTVAMSDLEKERIIHFDVSGLSEKSMAKQLGMHVILEWLLEKFMKKNPERRKRVVIDEAQKLLDSSYQAAAIEDIYRRFRKYSGSAMAASQDFLKFVENEQGRAIVQNSSIKVLLKQAKNDRQAVLDITGIEEHEFEMIALYAKGQSLCIVGDERFTNIVNPSAYELELYNTTHVMGEAERMRQRQRWVVG
ncbi:VirB4 family type IV secretion system protein [Alicyclobacillus sp. SP_1]|uniref:VirB4 family type IV secretion system protein n=1 Tax=Alicyclobacillus sp. SP_1 TaxID=2942475 RepID=UPI00215777DF|nr:DUF87 domain-containing protein [Alicyclobacillus sp. SP_1]